MQCCCEKQLQWRPIAFKTHLSFRGVFGGAFAELSRYPLQKSPILSSNLQAMHSSSGSPAAWPSTWPLAHVLVANGLDDDFELVFLELDGHVCLP